VLVQEKIRIKDARMQRIDLYKRSHDLPTERMVIFELPAARGWPHAERTARMATEV